MTTVSTLRSALVGLILLGALPLPGLANSSGGRDDPQQAAERAARAQERAARDAEEAQERASRAAADAAERTTKIEQRFAEDSAKAAADAARDPVKAAEDQAKAEADRARALADVSARSSNSGSGGSNSGSSGNSGSGSSGGSGNSGSGSDDSSGLSGSSSGSDGSGSAMRDIAREENPAFDQRGFPVRRGEVVALDLGDTGLAQAKAAGFRILSRDGLTALSGSVTRLATPEELTPEGALAALRTFDPAAVFDYTHYYGMQLAPQGLAERGGPAELPRRSGNLTVGMVDTGVTRHPVLAHTAIEQRRFGVAANSPSAVEHGTAVASILASGGSRRVIVADVFRGAPNSPFTSADAIAQSLEWLAERRVNVVNISLAGPRNAILDRLILRASERGMVIVAAAGNGGPAAPPAYPAALASVVAVTAVDARSHVYRYANQGDYIMVAARGVLEPAAVAGGGIGRFSGTSFATPHVATWFARCLNARQSNAERCRDRLRLAARDVGQPGRDPVYGWGVVE